MSSDAPKPIQIGLPRMSKGEYALFCEMLDSGFRRYGEFGLGGSTLEAVRRPFETIISVDSDPAWVEAAKTHPELAAAQDEKRLTIVHGNIGPVGKWGSPVDFDAMRRWPNYVRTFWAEWHRCSQRPDIVLVDGRFRVASALSVLLACGEEAPLVMMHDMSEGRLRGYGRVLPFFEVQEARETLWVLQPKRGREPMEVLIAFTDSLLTSG